MAALAPGPAETGDKGAVDGAGRGICCVGLLPRLPGLLTGSILAFSSSFPVLLPVCDAMLLCPFVF